MLRSPDRNLAMASLNSLRWRHFQPDIILLTVRWYLRYSLSYRELEEMMLERGIKVNHTTIPLRVCIRGLLNLISSLATLEFGWRSSPVQMASKLRHSLVTRAAYAQFLSPEP